MPPLKLRVLEFDEDVCPKDNKAKNKEAVKVNIFDTLIGYILAQTI